MSALVNWRDWRPRDDNVQTMTRDAVTSRHRGSVGQQTLTVITSGMQHRDKLDTEPCDTLVDRKFRPMK